MFNKKVKELEKRIQGMSEIITDFEQNVFNVIIDENCSMITNNTNKHLPNGCAIEVLTGDITNIFDEDGSFEGKKMEFQLKHPRSYR